MAQLTVMLSTRNGMDVLPRVLDGYTKQVDVDFDWRIVVVDNNSTDGSPGIIRQFEPLLPLTALRETRPGKNKALNTGLGSMAGDAVIFTDDDAIPAPDFLVSWKRTLDQHPEYDLFGGRIEPLFEKPLPEWMMRSRFNWHILFAVRDLEEGPMSEAEIYGPNMAVRSRVFESGLTFNENIGPNGSKNYPMGSETEFCRRAGAAGYKAWFARAPQVQHIVRPHQLTVEFWLQRSYRFGRGVAFQRPESAPSPVVPGPSLNHPLVSHTRRGIHRVYLELASRFIPHPYRRFRAQWQRQWNKGFADGAQERRNERSKPLADEAPRLPE